MNRQLSTLKELLLSDIGRYHLLTSIDLGDYNRLALTRISMYKFFEDDSTIRLFRLVYYLVQEPNDIKVKLAIRSDLNLLKVVFTEVKLRMRTTPNITLLQLVCGARDEVMFYKTLPPFFAQLYGSEEVGRDETQRQINAMNLFNSKGFDFGPIMQTISNESFNSGYDVKNRLILSSATLAAIQQFIDDFDTSQSKIIEKGTQFRLETLLELLEAYTTAVQWNYDYKKCVLLEDAVLSWVLSYAPENDGQRFSQSLYYLQKDNPKSFKCTLTVRDGYNLYEVLRQPSLMFVLAGSCIGIVYGSRRVKRWDLWGCGPYILAYRFDLFLAFCKTYIEQKLQAFSESLSSRSYMSLSSKLGRGSVDAHTS